jgi:hypothetical protein
MQTYNDLVLGHVVQPVVSKGLDAYAATIKALRGKLGMKPDPGGEALLRAGMAPFAGREQVQQFYEGPEGLPATNQLEDTFGGPLGAATASALAETLPMSVPLGRQAAALASRELPIVTGAMDAPAFSPSATRLSRQEMFADALRGLEKAVESNAPTAQRFAATQEAAEAARSLDTAFPRGVAHLRDLGMKADVLQAEHMAPRLKATTAGDVARMRSAEEKEAVELAEIFAPRVDKAVPVAQRREKWLGDIFESMKLDPKAFDANRAMLLDDLQVHKGSVAREMGLTKGVVENFLRAKAGMQSAKAEATGAASPQAMRRAAAALRRGPPLEPRPPSGEPPP